MQEKYIAFIKSNLLKSKKSKDLFFIFLDSFDITALKKFPDFELLKNNISSLQIGPQEIFSKLAEVAMGAVKKNRLETLQFLIDTCRYDLKNIAGEDGMTLLHEACLRNETEIVKYLLQKGFDPNAKNAQKATPLYSAIQTPNQEKSPEIIALLHQHKANLNIKNNQNLTPLHLAALCKNGHARLALLKLGSNPRPKWEGLTHIQLKKQVEEGKFENISPPINLALPEKTKAENAQLEYYKGCFSSKFDLSSFQKVRTLLLEEQRPLDKQEASALTNAILLTSSFSPFEVEKIASSLYDLIKKDKITVLNALSAAAIFSRFFCVEGQTPITAELNEFILNTVADQKSNIPAHKIFKIYCSVGSIYREVGLFEESEAAFLQAQLNSKKQADQKKSELFFNLGCVQRHLLKQTEAIKNFKEAFYLDKKDTNAFTSYINALLTNKLYDEALELIKQSNFGEYSRLFNLYTNFIAGRLTYSDILKAAYTTSYINRDRLMSLELKTECSIKLGNFEAAVILANKMMSVAEKIFEQDKDFFIELKIHTFLYTYIQASQFKQALAIAETLTKKYAGNFERSFLAMGTLAVLYATEGQFDKANDITKKIKLINADPATLSNIYYYFAVNLLSAETRDINYSMALQYINLALEIYPMDFRGNFYKLLIFILFKEKENAQNALQNLRRESRLNLDLITDLQKNSITEVAGITEEETVELEIEMENYDPIKIHAFWQVEKERVLKSTVENLSPPLKPKTIWKVGSSTFQEDIDGVTPIFHPRYPNCYAVIHPQLNLDPKLRKKCESVLANNDANLKSLSSDEKNQKTERKSNQGVQTLNNSVTQLKILGHCGDKRLWTNKVYRIDNKHLIVFDNCDDHEAILRKAQKANLMQVVDLQQISNAIPFQSSIFASADKNTSLTGPTSAKIPAVDQSVSANL